MVSPVLTEHFYTGAFLVSEAPGFLSRDPATMVNGTGSDIYYDGGLVLTDAPTVTAGGSNVGNGTITGLLLGEDAVAGAYVVTFTSSTSATLTDPTGRVVGTMTTGTAFKAIPEISLTATAGGTAFASGDTFTIQALGPAGTFAPYTSTSAPAAAVLFNRVRVPANGNAEVTVISRNAEVNAAELVYDPSITTTLQKSQAVAALATFNVIAR